jgi:hypothetical protein
MRKWVSEKLTVANRRDYLRRVVSFFSWRRIICFDNQTQRKMEAVATCITVYFMGFYMGF